jgi:integrase
MAAGMERTKIPGVYRRGSRYVVTWRDSNGQPRKKSTGTYDAARDLKRKMDQQATDGEEHVPAREQVTLAAYALDLFGADLQRLARGTPAPGRYQGRKGGAVRDATKADYRRDLEHYWLPALGPKRLPALTAPMIARVLADLAARDGDSYLADRTLKRLTAPMSALMATAAQEGVIGHNPVRDVRVPSGRDELHRFDADADDGDDPEPGKAKALTSEQVQAILLVVDVRWRVLFLLLAATGLRISEALALRWRDLQLDGSAPHVKVRRAHVRGVYGPPKSKHGRRDVPIGFGLVTALRERRATSEWHEDDSLVFPSMVGTPMSAENLARRTLKPAAEEAGVGWAAFHAFRHHCASRLIADGRNIVQVSRWLGHHSPSFTLSTYAHLMSDGVGAALELPGGNEVATSAPFGTTGDSELTVTEIAA